MKVTRMERQAQQPQKPFRLLTAQNGFVLHISPHIKPKQVKMSKSSGPHVIYGISYMHPEPMRVTHSN